MYTYFQWTVVCLRQANLHIIIATEGEGSGFTPEYGPVQEYEYKLEPINRKRLMIVLADIDYLLVRATDGGQDVNVVG